MKHLMAFIVLLGPAFAGAEGFADDPPKGYLEAMRPLELRMKPLESEHFIFWAEGRDMILAPEALEALEKAHSRIGSVMKAFPKEKVAVQVFRTKEDFSIGSTLSVEILDRSGAIGICKFKKLMILTPEALAFGYRWLDTLAHEYTHFLINVASEGRCPLWLHEGIAKYLETLWRLESPDYLSPGNRTELVRALKDGKLIAFSRMEPSMVYLKDHQEVRLAFSQVSHAVSFIESLKGRSAIRGILEQFAKGKSREDVFLSVLGVSAQDFELNWKRFLSEENLAESPGAAADVLKIGKAGNEIEDLTSVDIRGHIRLGDRLRERGQPQAALVQYQKAIEKEPYNPVALTKKARTLILQGKKEEALVCLERAVSENPNYASAFLLLGSLMIEKENYEKALKCFIEANGLNPFNPSVHEKLSALYAKLGDPVRAKREREIFERLVSGDQGR